MAVQTLDILLNPVIDVAKYNALIATLKNSFTTFSPINATKLIGDLASIKPEFIGISKSINGLGEEFTNTAKRSEQASKIINRSFNFNNMLASVNAVANALSSIVNVGINFESNLQAVGSITGFAGKQLDELGVKARELATSFGGSATDQLLSFQGVLSKLGPELAKDVDSFGLLMKNINILSKASGDSAATSMQAITDVMLQMGMAMGTPAEIAQKSTEVINSLAASAKVGAAEIPEVGRTLVVAGVAAKGAKLSLVEVNAAIQVLAQGGKRGSEAGTALRNVIGYLQKASGPAEDAMKSLGTSSEELGRILTTEGLHAALKRLNAGINSLGTDAEKNSTLMRIFGVANAAAAGILLRESDKFEEFSQGIAEGMQGTGDALIQATQRMDTAESIIDGVQAKISDAFISLSQMAGQSFTALVGITTQVAPLVATFAGLKDLIPDKALIAVRDYSSLMLSKLVPGLITQDVVTQKLVFNWRALSIENLKQRATNLGNIAINKVRIAQEQVMAGISQRLVNARRALTLSNIKENASNMLSSAMTGLQVAKTNALTFAKSALHLVQSKITKENLKQIASGGLSVALNVAKTASLLPLIAAQLALNVAMNANPIGLIVIGAGALIGAFVLLYKNVESVRTIFDGLWSVLKVGLSSAFEILKSVWGVVSEVGKLIINVLLTPTRIYINVLKEVFTAIGNGIASLLGMENATELFEAIVQEIIRTKDVIVSTLGTIKNFVSGVIDAVSSIGSTLGTGFGQLLSLDFTGAIETFAGTGSKASEAFNHSFNNKMREQKFDEAKEALEKGMQNAGDIEVKVTTVTDFKEAVKDYEDTQQRIAELGSKKKAGKLTKEETAEFDKLTNKAKKLSNDIASIAPSSIKGIKDTIVLNGELVNTYDINIAKAKEFANSNDFSTPMQNAKEAVSNNLLEMAKQFDNQSNAAGKLKNELKGMKPDTKGYDELKDKFKDVEKQSQEFRQELVKGFLEAGSAGMLTDGAIKSIAKSLKVSEDTARGMLLREELKKAGESGGVTETVIARLAKKYNKTADEVRNIANESKKQTDNVEETETAVNKLAEAWKKVSGAINSAFDDTADQMKITKKLMSKFEKDPIKFAKMIASESDAVQKALMQRIASGEGKEIMDSLNKTLKEQGKEVKENALIDRGINKLKETYSKLPAEKEKTEKRITTQYEKQREVLDEIKNRQEDNNRLADEKLKTERKINDFIETEQSKLLDSKALNERKLKDLQEQVEQYKQIEASLNSIKDTEERKRAKKDIENELKNIQNEITIINESNKVIELDIKINDKKILSELEKLKSEAQRTQIELNIMLGKSKTSDLDIFDIEEIKRQNNILKDEITKLNNAIVSDETDLELKQRLQEKTNLIAVNNNKIFQLEKELRYTIEKENINNISDYLEREKELKLFELKKSYEAETLLYAGNTQRLLALQVKYNIERERLNQEYIINSVKHYNAIHSLNATLANLSFGRKDNSQAISIQNEMERAEKEKDKLRKSYGEGRIDYDDYQQSLTDIQKEQSERRIELEQAEAQARKDVWKSALSELSSYFSTMSKEYLNNSQANYEAIKAIDNSIIENKKIIANLEVQVSSASIEEQASLLANIASLKQSNFEAEAQRTEATKGLYTDLAVSMGASFAQMALDGENMIKAVTITMIKGLRAMVPMFVAEILAKELIKSGPAGLIKAGVLTGAIYAALAVAESAVAGAFKDGVVRFSGKGTGTSDSNLVKISHGESIVTARASKDNLNYKFLKYANATGGNILDFIRVDKDLQRTLSMEIYNKNMLSSNRDVDILKELLLRRDEEVGNLKSELRSMRLKYEETNAKLDTIALLLQNNTLIETNENYNVKVENKVIKAVETVDYSLM